MVQVLPVLEVTPTPLCKNDDDEHQAVTPAYKMWFLDHLMIFPSTCSSHFWTIRHIHRRQQILINISRSGEKSFPGTLRGGHIGHQALRTVVDLPQASC